MNSEPTGMELYRYIRAFVSSTFRKMLDERDQLVPRIFPSLWPIVE